MVPNRSVYGVAYWSLSGGILGVLALILLDAPFITYLYLPSVSGFSCLVLEPISLFGLLCLNVAGGISTAVIGFILARRQMHTSVFPSMPSSKIAAKVMMLSGIFIIAGTIAALKQILIVKSENIIGIIGEPFLGGGVFAELFVGLAIVVLASVALGNMPK